MSTIEIAKQTKTKYFIEYICDDLNKTYWQLVRSKDAAILCAMTDLYDVYAHCFIHSIDRDEVTIW